MSSSVPADDAIFPPMELSDEERQQLISNYESVLEKSRAIGGSTIHVLPVSKTKHPELIKSLLPTCTTFGENYVQELCDKMSWFESQSLSIKFCFIGSLQSNKINKLAKEGKHSLLRIDTVSSEKVINKLSTSLKNNEWTRNLGICLQIDTSLEDSKSGIPYTDVEQIKSLIDLISEKDNLDYKGLMTIGAPGDSTCFDRLKLIFDEVGGEVLSMGMSGDFEEAIEKGSNEVRVGSTVFGKRDYPVKTN
ncbi:hypothetical protein TrLO_g15626 [Triparma laevis f. longispina]|uniref:Alanine racemase N-terminal domain-containing protein n=1 Tax=Triparma laevis f. longispina TaxID=1714387 RepID=A0A9W7FR84_9STRA|nr:hypothetical protein TrLO_g15626 [Triparma laevis f. longispina]